MTSCIMLCCGSLEVWQFSFDWGPLCFWEHREVVCGQRLMCSLVRYKSGQQQSFGRQHELYGAVVTSRVLWPVVTVRSL